MDCGKTGFCQVRRFGDPTGQGCKFRLYHPTVHSFSLLQALAKLTGMLSGQLLEVTQDEFESQYNLEAAKAKFLFNAAQGLSDPSATGMH